MKITSQADQYRTARGYDTIHGTDCPDCGTEMKQTSGHRPDYTLPAGHHRFQCPNCMGTAFSTGPR